MKRSNMNCEQIFQNEDGTSPSPARSRRRRRQDTLIPDDCPLTRDQIVDLPIDEFNELIESKDFTEAFKAQCRDWRRKGKNRVSLVCHQFKCWNESLKKNHLLTVSLPFLLLLHTLPISIYFFFALFLTLSLESLPFYLLFFGKCQEI